MVRKAASVLLVAVMTAACGARLSDQQREAGIGLLGASGSKAGGSADASTVQGDSQPSDSVDAAVAGESTARGDAGGESVSESAGSGGGGSGAATSPEKCKPGADTSDPGIDQKQVVVAVASDITGPSPGLFKASHEAVQAYANYVNSTGGLCGRAMKVLKLDTKAESGANRAAVLDACNKAFAMVGSMSAFDDGGGTAVDECGIPDLTAIPTSPQRVNAQWTYPAFPNRQDLIPVGSPTYVKNTFGDDVIKKAGILYLNATVTRSNALARKAAWETVGFEFVYEQQVQVLEANYTPFVQDMADAGVEYVTMVADPNSIARLLKAAQAQGYSPTVWDWDSVAYDPGFLDLAGDAAEGSYVFVNTKMIEEASANPEMARYAEWLAKSVPGAVPTYFGLYAWSAAALFAEEMRAIGPEPTRQALLDKLKATTAWDGHGLHGAHDLGTKTPSTCFVYMQIQGGKFVRSHPQAVNSQDCDLAGRAQL